MTYVLLQTGLEPPTLLQLQTAFTGVPGLTDFDAANLSRDAFGVLLRSTEQEEVFLLQFALAAQGVNTAVIPEALLPTLPPPQVIHSVECLPDALLVHDSLGQMIPHEWDDVLLIAAGQVRVEELVRIRKRRSRRPGKKQPWLTKEETVNTLLGESSPYRVEVDESNVYVEYESKIQRSEKLLLEIITGRAERRYSVMADKSAIPLFSFLGDRRTVNWRQNFRFIVQDLARLAPEAAVNRGADGIRNNGQEIFRYVSRGKFNDELVWLLWFMFNAAANPPENPPGGEEQS